MYEFDPNNVRVEFRDRVSQVGPIIGRQYTVTHNDETAELYVVIGTQIAEDTIDEAMRDDVLLSIRINDGKLLLVGSVLVSSVEQEAYAVKRNQMFKEEMPLALKGIRLADDTLYLHNMELDDVPIYLWFESNLEEYDQWYYYGTMKEYR